MNTAASDVWQRFLDSYREYPSTGVSLDLSRVNWPEGFMDSMTAKVTMAFQAMAELEAGGIANPDENRMVGHYWLRAPQLAPDRSIVQAIESTIARIKAFAVNVHAGEIQGADGFFKNIIVIGIGGSALGPVFVSKALTDPTGDELTFHTLDNTDPDGMDILFNRLHGQLGQTLCVVISKSGGTKETRNGMIETKLAFERGGLDFGRHAVAITQEGSQLDQVAKSDGWLDRFPMWDWVGGRTSELSAVGLLPAALQGIDIDSLLRGAAEMDAVTRVAQLGHNPAMDMALAWYAAGNGKGDKNLVILPYKDRLELLSKYLQQLIMDSIVKKLDLLGHEVHQGLSVFGNKGSTDQHSFVQQLRDGRNDFIVTFIEVLRDRIGESPAVESGLIAGDYLQGFYLGTRIALTESDRESISIGIEQVDAFSIGALIALFERTVGFYASLIGVNAYHQPGVEAGKKAAGVVVSLKSRILELLQANQDTALSCQDIADQLDVHLQAELVYKVCRRLAANPETGVHGADVSIPDKATFRV
jgi:glucose-6-phosphate isomerase